MGQIIQKWRVLTSILFSVALVVGAYVLVRYIESPSTVEASEESALLAAIAAKDSDGDGLPDWEENLYGTDPNKVDSYALGMSDGEAVAKGLVIPKAIADIKAPPQNIALDENGLPPPPPEGTLTNAFAKNFIGYYMAVRESNGGEDLTEEQMRAVAEATIESIGTLTSIAPDYKKEGELNVSGSGRDALVAFAKDAEAVFLKNTNTATDSEMDYLKRAVETEDYSLLPKIAEIAKTYRDVAVGISVLPVPRELEDAGLAFVNATMRLGQIISDFSRVNEDPLATIIALEQYPRVLEAFGKAIVAMSDVYSARGITLQPSEVGSTFLRFISETGADVRRVIKES